jgi:GTPase SAR1 family protein
VVLKLLLLVLVGSAKTTLLHRLVAYMKMSGIRGYVLNLDPAVITLAYAANIDIRDTIKYKEVMKESNLGPTGEF